VKVALFYMPFGIVEYPHLGTGLLKAALEREGIACDVHCLALDFARQVGREIYSFLEGNASPMLLGDRIFARALSENVPSMRTFYEDVVRPAVRGVDNALVYNRAAFLRQVMVMEEVEERALEWLSALCSTTDYSGYDVLGFSTSYEQNTASLALARRLREVYPDTPIVFGGANCAGDMGLGLLRAFPFIDYVATGEAERSLVALVRWLADPVRHEFPSRGMLASAMPRQVAEAVEADVIADLDSVPVPDFDDYFAKLQEDPHWRRHFYALAVEGSRGCWKARARQCLFCGLNGADLGYRSKSGERFVAELGFLCQRYGAKYVMATDNILSPRLLAKAFPQLAVERPYDVMWQEVKVGLRRAQLEVLRAAGARYLGAGIESLSTPILRLMRKGTTALENVHFLRMATEMGFDVTWHVICGFPGEREEHYREMAGLMGKLLHLIAPKQMVRITIDRHSPLYREAQSFGMRLQPSKAYDYIYDLTRSSIAGFAYCFQDVIAGDGGAAPMGPPAYAHVARRVVDNWAADGGSSRLGYEDDGLRLIVQDDRGGQQTVDSYRGMTRSLILAALDPIAGAALVARLLDEHPKCSQCQIEDELGELVERSYVIEDSGQYLFIGVDYAVQRRYCERDSDNFFLRALREGAPYRYDG
jgi:ribosomal peptide maturation radical SAM protein 1